MAKLVFTITVTLFLFALCRARISSDPIQNDATTVLLPSEKPDSELPTMVQFEPKKTDPKLLGSDVKESRTDSVHLTMVSFRPISHHFPRHSFPVTFRRGHHFRHHRRRHHHIHELKPRGPRFHGREVLYGDNMIVLDEKYSSSNHPLFRGGVPQIPARWAKFGHEGPRFHHRHVDVKGRKHMKKKRQYRPMEREHNHENGFMKKFRKFLMQF